MSEKEKRPFSKDEGGRSIHSQLGLGGPNRRTQDPGTGSWDAGRDTGKSLDSSTCSGQAQGPHCVQSCSFPATSWGAGVGSPGCRPHRGAQLALSPGAQALPPGAQCLTLQSFLSSGPHTASSHKSRRLGTTRVQTWSPHMKGPVESEGTRKALSTGSGTQ